MYVAPSLYFVSTAARTPCTARSARRSKQLYKVVRLRCIANVGGVCCVHVSSVALVSLRKRLQDALMRTVKSHLGPDRSAGRFCSCKHELGSEWLL